MKGRSLQRGIAMLGILVIAAAAVSGFFAWKRQEKPVERIRWGVTFSPHFAWELGVNSHEAFEAVLDELKPKQIRLPVHWSEVEATPGEYQFDEVDWLLGEAEKRKIGIILAIGQRIPRYPECHIPTWAQKINDTDRQAALLKYLRHLVSRFESSNTIVAWQVENEPLLENFGICPPVDYSLLEKEVALVRSLTKKPIMTTTSGEFGSWVGEAKLVDILGFSLYRGADFGRMGYVAYPISPAYYRAREKTVKPYVEKVVLSELQAEPWGDEPIPKLTLEEQRSLMPLENLKENIAFAQQLGIEEAYLWGAEWWFFMKKQGVPEYWNEAQRLMRAE